MNGPGFAWAVLPTWHGRYPLRYSVVLAVAAAVPLATAGWAVEGSWSPVLLGAAVGAASGVLGEAASGRRTVSVIAGRLRSRDAALDGLGSNQVLGVDVRTGRWSRQVWIEAVDGRPIATPVVSWRVWPVPGFDDQRRGLRLALGLPADPPG